ncbi:MAG: pentapeptide repeat-containing protein [Bacteriovoracia bacterium]
MKNMKQETYEIIQNEILSNCNIENETISGALLGQNRFHKVTFVNCEFFGSKIENCEFSGCNFLDCKFQFSNIYESNFSSCRFQDTLWISTNVSFSSFKYCNLDAKSIYFIEQGENILQNCFNSEIYHLNFLQEEIFPTAA